MGAQGGVCVCVCVGRINLCGIRAPPRAPMRRTIPSKMPARSFDAGESAARINQIARMRLIAYVPTETGHILLC